MSYHFKSKKRSFSKQKLLVLTGCFFSTSPLFGSALATTSSGASSSALATIAETAGNYVPSAVRDSLPSASSGNNFNEASRSPQSSASSEFIGNVFNESPRIESGSDSLNSLQAAGNGDSLNSLGEEATDFKQVAKDLAKMSKSVRNEKLLEMNFEEQVNVLQKSKPSRIKSFLKELSPKNQKNILRELSPAKRKNVKLMMKGNMASLEKMVPDVLQSTAQKGFVITRETRLGHLPPHVGQTISIQTELFKNQAQSSVGDIFRSGSVPNATEFFNTINNSSSLLRIVNSLQNKELVKDLVSIETSLAKSSQAQSITVSQVADFMSIASYQQMLSPGLFGDSVELLPAAPEGSMVSAAQPVIYEVEFLPEQEIYLGVNALTSPLVVAGSANQLEIIKSLSEQCVDVGIISRESRMHYLQDFILNNYVHIEEYARSIVKTIIEEPSLSVQQIVQKGSGNIKSATELVVSVKPELGSFANKLVLSGCSALVQACAKGAVASVAVEVINIDKQAQMLSDLVNKEIEEEVSGSLRFDAQEVQEIAKSLKSMPKSARNSKLDKIENIQDLADVLDQLHPSQVEQYLKSVDKVKADEVLSAMNKSKQDSVKEELDRISSSKISHQKYQDDLARAAKNKADRLAKEADDKKRLEDMLRRDKISASSHDSYDSVRNLYNSGSDNSGSRFGHARSRSNYSYATAAGLTALAGYVFSLDDSEEQKSPLAQRVDTANKLYAFCAEVVSQEVLEKAEQEAKLKQIRLDKAITAEFEALEAAGIEAQMSRYAQIIKSLYDMIDKLPADVQDRLNKLTDFAGQTVEAIDKRLKMMDIIPVSFQEKLAQVVPYLKLSAQDFKDKTLPEITRIIQVHVNALEDAMIYMEKGLMVKMKPTLLELKDMLENASEKSSANLYYLIAQLRSYAVNKFADLEQQGSQIRAAVNESINRLSEFTKNNLPSGSDIKSHIYATQNATKIAKGLLQAAKSSDDMLVTTDSLKSVLPSDVEATPFMKGYVQARLKRIASSIGAQG